MSCKEGMLLLNTTFHRFNDYSIPFCNYFIVSNSVGYNVGNWSTLEMKCDFKRNSAFYVYQVMGPTFLTVCLSWVSFVIRYDQHPARISLGITSVLTMEAIQLFIQTSLPRVSCMINFQFSVIILLSVTAMHSFLK